MSKINPHAQLKSMHDFVGLVINTNSHGKVRVLEFKEGENAVNGVVIYLDKYSMDTSIGSMDSGLLETGFMLVTYVDDDVEVDFDFTTE